MTEHAAIIARLLPHKGLQDCLRITAEVPLEEADKVTAALGWPSPSQIIEVAIVRVKTTQNEPPAFLKRDE